jgi:hypothetical protein
VLFEGRAVETVGQGAAGGELWAFDVARTVRGDVSGRLVADLTIEPDPDASGTVVVSSCALPVRVAAGATDEVAGNMGEAPDGEPRLYVNYCGGSIRQLQAARPTTTAAAESPDEGDASARWMWAAAAALALAAGGGALFTRRARRRSPATPRGSAS